MKVSIKDFGIGIEVGNTGIELEMRDPSGTHLGDIFVAKKGLIWCPGRTTRDYGRVITWPKFIAMMEEPPGVSRSRSRQSN